MGEAIRVRGKDDNRLTLAAAAASGEVYQLHDGRAGYLNSLKAGAVGDRVSYQSEGQVTLPKTNGIVLLDGGRAYWDWSANAVHFKKVDDRDFYIGRVVGDAASGDLTCTVNLNVDPLYDIDLGYDPYTTAPTGTQALGGFLPPQKNGGLTFVLSATNEAQKSDALGKDGFAASGAGAIVEFALNVINQGAGGSQDFNVGIASATHATDADAITQHLFAHMDGNANKINFQSKDGTNTTAATDSTKTITAGAGNANRVEVWMDLRDATNVKLYVDGVRVLSGTTFNVSASASRWLPLIHLEKTASTDVYQADVDFFRIRFGQQ